MYLSEVGWENVDWIYLLRTGNGSWLLLTLMNLQVPLKAENFMTSRETINSSRRVKLNAGNYSVS
jgi:hypothetical protein